MDANKEAQVIWAAAQAAAATLWAAGLEPGYRYIHIGTSFSREVADEFARLGGGEVVESVSRDGGGWHLIYAVREVKHCGIELHLQGDRGATVEDVRRLGCVTSPATMDQAIAELAGSAS